MPPVCNQGPALFPSKVVRKLYNATVTNNSSVDIVVKGVYEEPAITPKDKTVYFGTVAPGCTVELPEMTAMVDLLRLFGSINSVSVAPADKPTRVVARMGPFNFTSPEWASVDDFAFIVQHGTSGALEIIEKEPEFVTSPTYSRY